MELKDIKAIIDLMRKNNLAEFELERQDFKIKLKRANGGHPAPDETGFYQPAMSAPPALSLPPSTVPTSVAAAAPAATGPATVEIESPMIGTFYRAPSPESQVYVEVGSEVNAETVVCLIEAMKVMNEIKAEVKGVVTQVLVENAKPVEFGQPLFRIRPT
jgi:acetyl-CoA carboxylase biotin carboxyl carrier protein